MRHRVLLSVIAFALFPFSARADIQVVSVDRFVSAQALAFAGLEQDTDTGSVHSPQPGAFYESVSFHAEVTDGVGDGSSFQNSDILSNSVVAVGSATASAESNAPTSFGSGRGRSHLELQFTLADSSGYRIYGRMEAHGNGDSYLHLVQGTTVFHNIYAHDNATVPFSETGILPPGEYVLRTDAASTAWADPSLPFDYGFASYDVHFDLVQTTGLPVGTPGEALFLSIAPNPIRSEAVVFHRIPRGERASLDVFDVAGRLIRRLAAGESNGESILWDGRDEGGRKVSPGAYFVRLSDGERAVRKKVLLVR